MLILYIYCDFFNTKTVILEEKHMKEHIMMLNPSPFRLIKSKKKTIELRLYDEKRKEIKVGDRIIFINSKNPLESLDTETVELYVFDSFETLYRKLPLLECGYTEKNIDSASPKDMEIYYTKKQQEKYGVVGIKIILL